MSKMTEAEKEYYEARFEFYRAMGEDYGDADEWARRDLENKTLLGRL